MREPRKPSRSAGREVSVEFGEVDAVAGGGNLDCPELRGSGVLQALCACGHAISAGCRIIGAFDANTFRIIDNLPEAL